MKLVMIAIIQIRLFLLRILPVKKHPILRRIYMKIFGFVSPSRVKMNGFVINFDHKGVADFFSSEYEPLETKIFNKVIKPEWIVLDGGANVGYHTLSFSRLAKEVWAFEPAHRTFQYLNKNILENNARNIKAINKALSDVTGKASLEISNEDGTFMAAGSYRIGKKGKLEEIETIRADDLNQKFDFIKLDIEGYEYRALKGMTNILKTKPMLFIEFNPLAQKWIGENPTDLLSLLIDYGYKFYDIHVNKEVKANQLIKNYVTTLTNILCT